MIMVILNDLIIYYWKFMKNKTLILSLFLLTSIIVFSLSEKSHAADFSYSERKWLKTNPRLRFSEVEWRPLSYTSDHPVYKGIIADYIKIICTQSGLKMDFVKSNTWHEVLEKYRKNEIDLIPALAKEDDIGAKVLMTDSYISFPLVIAAKSDTVFIGYTHELEGKRVGAGKGYTSYNFLKKNYPIFLQSI